MNSMPVGNLVLSNGSVSILLQVIEYGKLRLLADVVCGEHLSIIPSLIFRSSVEMGDYTWKQTDGIAAWGAVN